MQALPIIFFNYGNPEYLKYSLKQAKYFNPDSTVYLLGDRSNDRYPFVTHVDISSIISDAEVFTKLYVHLSPNSKNYELNCFLRWFYIKAFCEQQGIESFIYLDSDVLVFQNFTQLRPYFGDSTIANTYDLPAMPAVSYFKDQRAISSFCDFLIRSYSDEAAIRNLEYWYDRLQADPKTLGAISDMVLFYLYFQEHPRETLKIDLINDGIAVDVSIKHADGYKYENGVKKVYWQNGLPYCEHIATGKLVRFATLHYQGDTKPLMREHYKGGGYELKKLWESSPLKAKVKKIKTGAKKFFKK